MPNNNDVIGITLKAFEEFEDAFRKFQKEVNATTQAEKALVSSTDSVNEAMTSLVQAKLRAKEASEKFNKALADMTKGENQGAEAAERFDKAFRELVASEKMVEQHTEKVNAALKESGVTGKQAQSVLKHLENQMKDNSRAANEMTRSSRDMSDSLDELMGFLGQVGVIYAFTQGLREMVNVGRDLEAQLTKVAAITNESVNNFSGFIFNNSGSLFAPSEQAKAMIDLGAAGLQSADMLRALPDVLDLATAGLVNLEQATIPVLNVLKTFEEPVDNTRQVVDAFVEAANRSALQVEDLSLSMAMSSAAARLAGMDYRELVTVLMILRDSGLQASDAGTSIKSALLAMMNPSKEATKYMDQLGISIYDAQGNMKDWASIIGEFERGLVGLTEQERNLVLSTIAGSDGIRALSLSMNRGSGFIRQTTQELQNAEGAARDVAATMEQTFDATLKRTTNNLQLMAATVFNDVEPALTSMLKTVSEVIEGFNQMDESTRQSIEMLIGAGGLFFAITSIIGIVQKLIAVMRAAQIGTLLLGPAGLATAAVTLLGIGLLDLSGRAEEARRKQSELNRELEEMNRIQRDGLDKGQLEAAKARVQSIEEEINKLREAKAEQEAYIEKLNEQGQWSSAANEKIEAYNAEIERLTKNQKILNDAIGKAAALDVQSAQAMANKAAQTKLEVESTTRLIDEYINLENQQKLTSDQQQRLSELAGILGQKYLYLVTAIDENGKAVRLNAKELDNERKVLKALAQAEMDNARATMQANLAKTQAVLAQAKQRINILMEEQQTLLNFARAVDIDGTLPGQMNDYVANEIKKQQNTIEQATSALNIYKAGLESLGKVNVGAGVSTKSLNIGSSGGKGSKSGSAGPDPFTEAMNLFNYQKELSDMSTENQIANLKRVRDAFIANGKWTLDQHRQIDVQIVGLQRQRMQEQLNYSRTWIDTQKALNKLSTEDEIAAWNRVKSKYKLTREEMMQIDTTIYQLQEQARKEQVEKARAWIDEQVFYDRLSLGEQIAAWNEMKIKYQLSREEMAEVDRNVYSLQKDMVNDYVSILRDAYSKARDAKLESLREEEEEELDSLDRRRREYEKNHRARLEQLDKETEAVLKSLQVQIDAIEEQGRQEDESKKEEDRSKRLLELQTEYEKYRNATSVAGKQKLADIEQEIADIQWEIQKEANDRARQEQIDALKGEMDNIREQADQKKDQLREQYETQQEWFAREQEGIREHYADMERRTRDHYDALMEETRIKTEAIKMLQEQGQLQTVQMLEGYAPKYQNAGATLGKMFAEGIESQYESVVSAAQKLAEAASDYLELHSPAKKGPLSTLDNWWKPLGQTLAGGVDRGPVESASSNMAGSALGGGDGFKVEINIDKFYGTRENVDELGEGIVRKYSYAKRAKGGR